MPDRLGFVDSLLFALIVGAQQDAEREYLDHLATGPYPDRLDGVAEGLARAVSLLGGEHPAIVRKMATESIGELRRIEAEDRGRSAVAVAQVRAVLARAMETGSEPLRGSRSA